MTPQQTEEHKHVKNYANRSNRFLLMCAIIGAVIGFLYGFGAGSIEDPVAYRWPIIIVSALVALAALYYTIRYYKMIDEHDLLANLYGSNVSLYSIITMSFGWTLLNYVKLTGEPELIPILAVGLILGWATYLWMRYKG